jgi:hypothetical protein
LAWRINAISRATTSRFVSLLAIGPNWPAATVTNLVTNLPSFVSRIDRPIIVLARTMAAPMQIPRLLALVPEDEAVRSGIPGTFVANLQRFPTI